MILKLISLTAYSIIAFPETFAEGNAILSEQKATLLCVRPNQTSSRRFRRMDAPKTNRLKISVELGSGMELIESIALNHC